MKANIELSTCSHIKRGILLFFIILPFGSTKADAYGSWSAKLIRYSTEQFCFVGDKALLKNEEVIDASTPLLEVAQIKESIPESSLYSNAALSGIVVVSVGVLLFWVITLATSRKKLRKANQQLAASNKEICRQNEVLLKQNQEVNAQREDSDKKRKTLEETNQVKDKIFSIISHDFRSPLNTIQGVLNLLHMDVLSPEELKSMLPHLTRKVDYSINLLDNLLNWSRTQMNGLKVNTITFTLEPEIEETVSMMSQLARQKSIRIEKNILKNCLVLADPDMIQLVVRNLLSNAIKFTNPGGLIRISTEVKGTNVVISISDTGIGMDEASIQKLFKQTGYTTKGTAEEKGTGLGLRLCSEFVHRNGGEISVESKLDEGTSFYFTLPLSEVLEEVPYEKTVLRS